MRTLSSVYRVRPQFETAQRGGMIVCYLVDYYDRTSYTFGHGYTAHDAYRVACSNYRDDNFRSIRVGTTPYYTLS